VWEAAVEAQVAAHSPAAGFSPAVPSGPSPVKTEITCPRCGQPSPRGLCEACEYALLELRELMIGLERE
jgi:hypothetical protein